MGDVEAESVHLDEILKKFGAFGRYQVQAILLIGFAFFNNAMHCANYILVAEDVPYRCKIDQCDSQSQVVGSWLNFTTPNTRSCYKYGSDYKECTPSSFNTTLLEPCAEWIYETEDSFIGEFQLACQDWKRTLVGTMHSIGLMIGLMFQGQLSDKIGRKAAIVIAGLAAAVLGIAKSFATSYITFIALELIVAAFGDNCSPAYIMSVELVHKDYRLQQQLYLSIIYATGGVAFAAAGYYVRYWRNFIRAIYAPSILFILIYFVMDESARWLLSKGKKEEATKLLLKIAKMNNVDLDKAALKNIQCEEPITQKSPMMETFRSKIVVRRFLICLIWWISCTFVCFGLIVNVVSLAGNKYVNIAFMSLSDIPASFAMVYTLKRFNRKKPLLISFLTAGSLCLIQPFIPREHLWLSVGLYFLGRFVSTFTFSTVYMYTSELFPTYSRNSLHALCSGIGRIGSILAPMTPLLTQYAESLPTLLIGSISIFAGLTTLLVPDLADEPLPDNVQQAETIGRVKSKCCS
ncbi:solute carrier family 22 member 1-like [Epargyreus clarus]|uniref:solute carrier family 22 member 1-like n=1 Tax=Epargyreus clarus TaxID=520877 RepID=UPI003C2ABC84